MNEKKLIEKLRLIESLYSGAKTKGEKQAAENARGRILERLSSLATAEKPVEYRFRLNDPWNRRVFLSLTRRYGLKPYRYKGQRHTTVMVNAPKSFIDETLWPEFTEISETLQAYLNEVTDRVISEVIHADSSEATVATETLALEPAKEKKKNKTETQHISKNAPCPCSSGKKYKKCCGKKKRLR